MRIHLISLILALLWAATATAASSSEEARAWIKRMNDALINRNYDGVLTHKWQGGSEALHLIHRMRDGRMVERMHADIARKVVAIADAIAARS